MSEQLEMIKKLYGTLTARHNLLRRRLGRNLTQAEKILFAHLDQPESQELKRGESFLMLRPDRIALQDATAQMAILQFISSGKKRVAVPTTVHCDHLIIGRAGAEVDMPVALKENKEVFDFLATSAKKYGMGFWKPGAGIIHQVVLENYAFPGGLMIGTDSHTPNAGGMGMLAIGVGGADAVDVMAGMPWELLNPKLIGVRLKGKLNGWTSPKDVILKMLEILTCAGGTNKIVEYFGEGVASISLTGRGTITNMGAELGATTSVFPFDDRTVDYLNSTFRADIAAEAKKYANSLNADPDAHANPEKYYDQVIEIDLNTLEPMLVGPHSPDIAHSASQMKEHQQKENYPDEVRVGLIGSCTNSSYEDIGRAAHVARQALTKGIKPKAPLLVTPGSDQVYATLTRDGQLETLKEFGATILANACGPCIGQWKREGMRPEEVAAEQAKPNVIVTSFNRNFRGRNDGFNNTLAFIGSPEVVVAKTVAGSLSFNPVTDTIDTPNGPVKLDPPVSADLPAKGFVKDEKGFQAPANEKEAEKVQVVVAPNSERLQLLAPFDKWNGQDISGARVLVKALGKCTTDHISAAGKWLKFRGHLDNISNNLLIGATNAFTNEIGKGKNLRTGETGKSFPEIARDYKANGIKWVVVGDNNYGEGSSREHAALEPRFLGGVAIITKSFARIHETNLKKQGMLPLTFADPADYAKIREDDLIDITGLNTFAPGKPLTMVARHADGSSDTITLKHSFNAEQILWFKAGSALNLLKQMEAPVLVTSEKKAMAKAKSARKTKAKAKAKPAKKSAPKGKKPAPKAVKKKARAVKAKAKKIVKGIKKVAARRKK
ncbi:MAG TPA: aconitate hydratase [Planctomycetota bacterium]|nr:aconitate hydratase [Planctomycetota bacterium]